jgi:hypothetical protein
MIELDGTVDERTMSIFADPSLSGAARAIFGGKKNIFWNTKQNTKEREIHLRKPI